jgi:hypothetical protein
MTLSAGSPSATAATTSMSSRCWPARTAASPACRTSGTRPRGVPRRRRTLRLAAHRPGDRTAARRARAENEKTQRRSWQEPPRVSLKRAVSTAAAGASSEQEFFTRLDHAGVLVRKRFSSRNPGEVTGYSVALPGDTTRAGTPVWFGGGKLAPDLTLPKLRCRWQPARTTPGDPFTPAERSAIWEHAARTAADASDQIRHLTATDPCAAADAAWAAADTLHAAAAALRSRVLRQAADSYDRAARAPYGRIPGPTPAGNSLRRAARLLSTAASVSGDFALAQITLVTRLAALAEDIADLREAQRHAAQAAAARHAAERLYAARAARPQPPRQRDTARTVGHPISQDFPFPISAVLAAASHEAHSPAPPSSRPSRSPGPPRPRGPTR